MRSADLELKSGCVNIWIADKTSCRIHAITVDLCVDRSRFWIIDADGLVETVTVSTAREWNRSRLEELGFADAVVHEEEEAVGWGQECPADQSMAAMCLRVPEGFIVALERGDDGADAIANAGRSAEDARAVGHEVVLRENTNWWSRYWSRTPRISIPDPEMMRLYFYGLYKLGAATNPYCPLPAGLQGPWVEEYQWPPWSADYHFNVNLQQLYTLALESGQLEHILPLFDWIEANKETFKAYARTVCEIDDGIIIGMCIDDRGGLLGLGPGVLIDHACTGWVAQLYWKYYLRTGDTEFLRVLAFPFMKATLRAYESMLEKREDGSLSLAVGISAEFGNDISPRLMGRDPSWQLACIHMLAEILSKAAGILGVEPDPAWQVIRERVPAFSVVGEGDEKRIGIWEGQDLTASHRHHSHLACVYPFDTWDRRDPEVVEIVENSIDHWIATGMGKWSEWCMPWAAILQARMGFGDGAGLLLHIWRKLFVNEGMAAVYLPRFRGFTLHRRKDQLIPREKNEIMQLDGSMSYVSALYEMLIQTRGRKVILFAAVPGDWRDISLSAMRIEGRFVISAEMSGGLLARVVVESEAGGSLVLDTCPLRRAPLFREDSGHAQELPIELSLERGESITFTAKQHP